MYPLDTDLKKKKTKFIVLYLLIDIFPLNAVYCLLFGCCKCLYLYENIPIIEQIKQTHTTTELKQRWMKWYVLSLRHTN